MTKSKPPRVIVPLAWFAGLTLPILLMPEQGWEFLREHVSGWVVLIYFLVFVAIGMWLYVRTSNYSASKGTSHWINRINNIDLSGCGLALMGLLTIAGLAATYYIRFHT